MPQKVHIRHFGKVIKGRKVYNNQQLYNHQLEALEGQEFEEITKKRTKNKTISQNDYYRGAILPTCYASEMFAHYDKPDDIHEEYFKEKFLSYTKLVNMPNGSKIEKIKYRSTSDLNREEMSTFIEKVLIDCACMNIIVLSGEQYYNKLYNL